MHDSRGCAEEAGARRERHASRGSCTQRGARQQGQVHAERGTTAGAGALRERHDSRGRCLQREARQQGQAHTERGNRRPDLCCLLLLQVCLLLPVAGVSRRCAQQQPGKKAEVACRGLNAYRERVRTGEGKWELCYTTHVQPAFSEPSKPVHKSEQLALASLGDVSLEIPLPRGRRARFEVGRCKIWALHAST